MKKIIYKEIVEIDDKVFEMKTCDYSESIQESIDDGFEFDNDQEIANHVYEDER